MVLSHPARGHVLQSQLDMNMLLHKLFVKKLSMVLCLDGAADTQANVPMLVDLDR